ncbi:CaiB/BaiF CoA transferase family protein [Lacrimispora sp.]|uniref:CaiB/BaiF CoA transferase family protein n=1 Tax=Lacrimispora sp. TaxID=2719234 RepID=UPI00399454BF
MMKKKLLDGVVVLDLTRVLAGPYCGMLLADMGAVVYKIEVPGKGDDSRSFGPYVNGESAYYMNFNRGKIGCTLNLKKEEGKDIFKEMVKKADIVIENYRPGTMEKLGLGYDVLKEINPRLIYGAVSGFGHYGPYHNRAGYDIIGQAMGGLMSTTGWPGGEATRTGTPMGDVLGGLNLTIGILAALFHVRSTGIGEKVDVSLVDSVVSSMTNINLIYLAEGRIPERIGNRYESTYPYDSFKAKDNSVIIGAGNDKLYKNLCVLMGMPELADDPRFLTVKDRVQNHEAMKQIIETWTKQYTVEEITSMLNKEGIPGCPINSIDKVVIDPQIAGARNMFPQIEHPVAGLMRLTNNAIKFTESNADPVAPAPVLGQDNDLVFGKFLEKSNDEINALKEKSVI